jgi:hypothetical protein
MTIFTVHTPFHTISLAQNVLTISAQCSHTNILMHANKFSKKMAVFWDVAPSSLKQWSVSARSHGATSQKRTIRGDKLLWNVGQCLLDYTVLHPRIQPSSYLQILPYSQGFIQIPTLPTPSQSCACMDTCTNTHTIYQYMCYVFSAEMFPN